jgi:hypothetical protein
MIQKFCRRQDEIISENSIEYFEDSNNDDNISLTAIKITCEISWT